VTHYTIALKAFGRREDIGGNVKHTFVREIENLIHPSHPRVVGYSPATRNSSAQIETRYAVNGSLRDWLAKSVRFLGDRSRAIVVCGIFVGMRFIHSQGVVHRDLKPENILLEERGLAQIRVLTSIRCYGGERTGWYAPFQGGQ
jgi:serine/threonine protein kinase